MCRRCMKPQVEKKKWRRWWDVFERLCRMARKNPRMSISFCITQFSFSENVLAFISLFYFMWPCSTSIQPSRYSKRLQGRWNVFTTNSARRCKALIQSPGRSVNRYAGAAAGEALSHRNRRSWRWGSGPRAGFRVSGPCGPPCACDSTPLRRWSAGRTSGHPTPSAAFQKSREFHRSRQIPLSAVRLWCLQRVCNKWSLHFFPTPP